ncbi:ABC transporter permease [Paracoccus pantotrophus]|uniref:ABC transporter permease n=1 Tax=Paracoccus pantotrophus TaxID=82367 RepID=A0A7H9BP55_PARPN|nr:ABC transporter permease [Paracoccus pantotrophus]QLH13070.1 ABC transporter permease [Paracoccus pantotrophus]
MELKAKKSLWLRGYGILALLFLNLPLLIIIPISFSGSRIMSFPPESFSLQWYERLLGSSDWMASLGISFQAALFTTLLAVPLGSVAAYGLARSERKSAKLVTALLLTPSIIPIVVVAIGIFFLFSRLGLNNTILGLTLAHTCLALPFVVITMNAGFQRFDFTLVTASRSLGAGSVRTFLTIALPNVIPSVVTSAMLAFITSLDEVVVALFITSGANSSLPRRMFASLRDDLDPTVAAASALLILLAIVFVAISSIVDDR